MRDTTSIFWSSNVCHNLCVILRVNDWIYHASTWFFKLVGSTGYRSICNIFFFKSFSHLFCSLSVDCAIIPTSITLSFRCVCIFFHLDCTFIIVHCVNRALRLYTQRTILVLCVWSWMKSWNSIKHKYLCHAFETVLFGLFIC